MGKHVLGKHGTRTALVFVGWLAFAAGTLVRDPMLKLFLMAGARVLP